MAADPPPSAAPPDDDPPVTVMVARRVRPGQEAAFERWLEGITAAASGFEGHLGATIFRPASPRDREYRVVFKFDHRHNLRRWEESDVRRDWYARAEPLTEGPPDITVLTGLETWFTLPGGGTVTPPRRYKMALVSWLGATPTITLIFVLLGPWLGRLPLPLRTMLIAAAMATLMTYVVMPLLTRLFAGWLYPERRDRGT